MGLFQEKLPKGEVGHLLGSEGELLILVSAVVQAETQLVEEMAGERYDASNMVEASKRRLQLAVSAPAGSDDGSMVRRPGFELVVGKQNHQEAAVEQPS